MFLDECRITHEVEYLGLLRYRSPPLIAFFLLMLLGCTEWTGSKIIQFIVGRRARIRLYGHARDPLSRSDLSAGTYDSTNATR